MKYDNLDTIELAKIAVEQEHCILTEDGAIISYTGKCTGRSPNAKHIVEDNLTKDQVDWSRNNKMSLDQYYDLKEKFLEHKQNNKCYTQDVLLVRDPRYSVGFRIYTEYARHAMFVRNMFITEGQIIDLPENPDLYEIVHFPSLLDEPTVVISVEDKTILISGTLYSGEIKKSAFTLINFLTPISNNFLPMHCSANADHNNDNVAIFFGLSGTGKTTLSAHPGRILIGDDEHLWTDHGITNIEGGCYAKTIRLSKEKEPEIWDACETTGTILENVVVREDGEIDYDDATVTENTRASYSTDILENSHIMGFINKHPKNIIMLTCDAFGVLPPVSKLSSEEAVKQFLLGYTAKVAGTEEGVKEPKPTFSPCFGEPFMPLKPERYAKILKEKIEEHGVDCWLVNTGWTGGPYGVGERISLKTTRLIIELILDGIMSKAVCKKHEYTNFSIPLVDYASKEIMFPENGWNSLEEYKQEADKLINMMGSK
jgi:phosphoenolpyruvate carboxykinase (ATP)